MISSATTEKNRQTLQSIKKATKIQTTNHSHCITNAKVLVLQLEIIYFFSNTFSCSLSIARNSPQTHRINYLPMKGVTKRGPKYEVIGSII